jgi:hypothetical protein
MTAPTADRVRYVVAVEVEAKDAVTYENVAPGLPAPLALASRLSDVLADETRSDALIGWRVTVVAPLDVHPGDRAAANRAAEPPENIGDEERVYLLAFLSQVVLRLLGES